MEQICKYNKDKDLKEVDQFGYVNLAEAYVHGTIPANVASDGESYNNIEDPKSIAGKPSDTFEALEMAKGLSNVVNNERSTSKEAEGN